jgi:sugar lactone lactonase YvrE
MKYLYLSILVLLTSFYSSFAQAPNIGYQTPNVYVINNAIAPLIPTNTGGAVPAIAAYGQVSTFAGTGSIGTNNGVGATATFNSPTRTALDLAGNGYIADRDNNLIRKITPAGVVSTFASGFNQPNGTVVDALGNVYVADAASNSIKKITAGGIVTTYAGGSQGSGNGPALSAGFYYPYGVALDAAGNVYVADSHNFMIRKITPLGLVSTFAGSGSAGSANGTGTGASFSTPGSVTTDAAGNVYVCDGGNNMIRKITPAGIVTTLAGSLTAGSANGTSATATFSSPSGMTVDPLNNFYIADLANNQIRKIDAAGIVTTLAGNTTPGITNGIGTAASFRRPNDAVFDPSGFLLVTDYGNSVVRKVSVTGYSIDKTLPAGLSFDGTTGKISGTPTAISPLTVYTVTAYNIFGSSTTTVSIQIIPIGTLLITANDQTRAYGVANPPLTVTYSGFTTGDDASKLTTQPIVATTATIASSIGSYPITVSGASSPKYTITYVAGTLTVTVIPRVLTFGPIADKIVSDPDFDPGATVNTNDPITYTSSDPTIATIINGKIHVLKPGTVIITATVAPKANYADVVPKSQTLLILDDLVRIVPVVTPNGDNINDVLRIDGIANYPDNRFTLVNINGVKIFEIDGYDNITNVFDGHSNITGIFQPKGTYFYTLQFNVHGEKKRRVGYVVLKY